MNIRPFRAGERGDGGRAVRVGRDFVPPSCSPLVPFCPPLAPLLCSSRHETVSGSLWNIMRMALGLRNFLRLSGIYLLRICCGNIALEDVLQKLKGAIRATHSFFLRSSSLRDIRHEMKQWRRPSVSFLRGGSEAVSDDPRSRALRKSLDRHAVESDTLQGLGYKESTLG